MENRSFLHRLCRRQKLVYAYVKKSNATYPLITDEQTTAQFKTLEREIKIYIFKFPCYRESFHH